MLTSQAKWKQCTKMIIATAAAQRNRTFFFEREVSRREEHWDRHSSETHMLEVCTRSDQWSLWSFTLKNEGFTQKVMQAGLVLQLF